MRHCSVSACKTFVLGRTIASAPRICPKSALSLLPLIRPPTTFPTTRIRDEKLDAFGVPGHHPSPGPADLPPPLRRPLDRRGTNPRGGRRPAGGHHPPGRRVAPHLPQQRAG